MARTPAQRGELYWRARLDKIKWDISQTENTDWPFSLYCSTIHLQMKGLNISPASNFRFPFQIEVRGGYVLLTSNQMRALTEKWVAFAIGGAVENGAEG